MRCLRRNSNQRSSWYSIPLAHSTDRSAASCVFKSCCFWVSNVFPDLKDELRFEPHLIGPHSFKINQIRKDLITDELIEERNKEYRLMLIGKGVSSSLKLSEELREVIEEFKEFLHDLTEDEILTFVYVLYLEYISESTRWDRLRPKRKEIAMPILKKSKVSFAQAAKIAGDEQHFIRRQFEKEGRQD